MRNLPIVVALLACSATFGQTPKAAKPTQVQPTTTTAQKPDVKQFNTYEDWIEAVINWEVDQRIATSGKQLTLLSNTGRYQIVVNPNVRADTLLLDTQTGRIWRPTAYTDLEGNPTAWIAEARIDSDQELTTWINSQTFKKK